MKSSSDNQKGINKYSRIFTQDETQPAAKAMLYGIGLTDADMHGLRR